MFGTFQKEIAKPTYGVTRPTGSFNPVYAQWKPVADLWRDIQSIPGLLDKIRFLFAPPGWYPESVGGPQSAVAITGAEQKFDPRPPKRLAAVLIGRWMMLLGIALLALERKDAIASIELAGALAWVFCALAAVGELWNRRWNKGVLVFAWGVDITFLPIASLMVGEMVWGYAPILLLAFLSAAATAWALWASRSR